MLSRTCLVLLVLLVPVLCTENPGNPSCHQQFDEFKVRFGREYGAVDEERTRREIFCETVRSNAERNQKASASGYTTRFGINQFADLTPSEFHTQYLTYKPSARAANHVKPSSTLNERLRDASFAPNAEDRFDWRDRKAVTPVKDQRKCVCAFRFLFCFALHVLTKNLQATAGAVGQ